MRVKLKSAKILLILIVISTIVLIHTQNLFKKESTVYRNYQYFDQLPSWKNSQRPWFMAGGTVYPTNSKELAKLLPEQADGDRIVDQLMYVPNNYKGYNVRKKLILSYQELGVWNDIFRNNRFHEFDNCPVNNCILTDDHSQAEVADAILFKHYFTNLNIQRPITQLWILFVLESPYHSPRIDIPYAINWTASYRRDSDISIPYGKWVYYNTRIQQKPQNYNYAVNKKKKVAWFVSNCNAHNDRLEYAQQLAEHITVDIYGSCGSLQCTRTNPKCFEALAKDYKFYLSFENSNCMDYITEKLFENAYGYNVVPIVMGAHSEVYRQITPKGSFIHIDDYSSPADLATYLHKLDQNDDLYNSYFKWKGTGEFINHYFWCRLCAMLHSELPNKNYKDINEWWNKPGICIGDRTKKSFWSFIFRRPWI